MGRFGGGERVNLFRRDAISRPLSGSAATDRAVCTCEHSSLIGFSRVRFSRDLNEATPPKSLQPEPRDRENRVRGSSRAGLIEPGMQN